MVRLVLYGGEQASCTYNVTNVVCPRTSVIILRLFMKSNAVDASRPRVELSQHCTRARVAIISAILTRFLSPPETPRTNSSPTSVCLVWEILSIFSSVSWTSLSNSLRDTPGRRPFGPGVLLRNNYQHKDSVFDSRLTWTRQRRGFEQLSR